MVNDWFLSDRVTARRIRGPRTANSVASAQFPPNVFSPSAIADRGGICVFSIRSSRSYRPAVDQEASQVDLTRIERARREGDGRSRCEMDTAKSRRLDVAPGGVCGLRVLSSSKRKRHQSRQPCASRPAARRRRGVWRRNCLGVAGRFRHRDPLKNLPNKHMGLYRRQTFGNRARVYAQSKHCPGIARSFGLNHDLPDHRQFSTTWAGKAMSFLTSGRAHELAGSGFPGGCPQTAAYGCPSKVKRRQPIRGSSRQFRMRTAIKRSREDRGSPNSPVCRSGRR